MDLDEKLLEAAARIERASTAGQIVSAEEMRTLAQEAASMRRQRDNLLTYIKGISRQTAEMARSNT
jgi:hypothetical protein